MALAGETSPIPSQILTAGSLKLLHVGLVRTASSGTATTVESWG